MNQRRNVQVHSSGTYIGINCRRFLPGSLVRLVLEVENLSSTTHHLQHFTVENRCTNLEQKRYPQPTTTAHGHNLLQFYSIYSVLQDFLFFFFDIYKVQKLKNQTSKSCKTSIHGKKKKKREEGACSKRFCLPGIFLLGHKFVCICISIIVQAMLGPQVHLGDQT